jgi:hypothetical protein
LVAFHGLFHVHDIPPATWLLLVVLQMPGSLQRIECAPVQPKATHHCEAQVGQIDPVRGLYRRQVPVDLVAAGQDAICKVVSSLDDARVDQILVRLGEPRKAKVDLVASPAYDSEVGQRRELLIDGADRQVSFLCQGGKRCRLRGENPEHRPGVQAGDEPLRIPSVSGSEIPDCVDA